MNVPAAWTQLIVRFFGIPPGLAEGLVALIPDPSCWMRSRIDGISVIRVPLPDGAVRGLLARGLPGITIPGRPSHDVERLLVLQGEVLDTQTNEVTRAGGEIFRSPDVRGPLELAGITECLFCIWVGPRHSADLQGISLK